MNPDHKKTVLRMIPYGIYVLTPRMTGKAIFQQQQ